MNCEIIEKKIESKKLELELIQKEFSDAIGNDKAAVNRRVKSKNLEIKELQKEYQECMDKFNRTMTNERELLIENNIGYDIFRWRREGDNKYYLAEENTNYSRGNLLREACSEAEEHDILYLNSGYFDINAFKSTELGGKGDLIFPLGVKIKGNGMDDTVLYTRKDGDGRRPGYINKGMPFQLGDKTILEDLTIMCETDSTSVYRNLVYEEDIMTLGYYPQDSKEVAYSSKINRCKIISNAWAISFWGNDGDSCDIVACEIISGRQGVSIMGSGSSNGLSAKNSKVNIHQCNFYIDVNKYNIEGDVSDPEYGGAYGVISRGAQLRVEDCNFYLIGDEGKYREEEKIMPMCIGISDSFDTPGASFTNIKSINNSFNLKPNKATIISGLYEKIETKLIFTLDILSVAEGIVTKKDIIYAYKKRLAGKIAGGRFSSEKNYFFTDEEDKEIHFISIEFSSYTEAKEFRDNNVDIVISNEPYNVDVIKKIDEEYHTYSDNKVFIKNSFLLKNR